MDLGMVTAGNGNITKQPLLKKENNSANLAIKSKDLRLCRRPTYQTLFKSSRCIKCYSTIQQVFLKTLALVSTTTIKNLQLNEKLDWSLRVNKKSIFYKLLKDTTQKKGLQCGSF